MISNDLSFSREILGQLWSQGGGVNLKRIEKVRKVEKSWKSDNKELTISNKKNKKNECKNLL